MCWLYRMEFKKNYRIVGTRVEENGELHGTKLEILNHGRATKRSCSYVYSLDGKMEYCPCK
jgi:hypothetical protein